MATDVTVVLETVAASFDPTAPHRIDQPIDVDRPVHRRLAPYIDHMSADIVDRAK